MATPPTDQRKITVTVHDCAKADLHALKCHDGKGYYAMLKLAEDLSNELDPRKPANVQLDVCELRFDAPNWYRAKGSHKHTSPVTRWYRVVFRLLVRDSDGLIRELGRGEALRNDTECAIQIVHVFNRGGKDYQVTKQRRGRVE